MSAQPLPPMQTGGSLDSMSSTASSNDMGSPDVLSTSPLAATGNFDTQMQDLSRGDSYEAADVEPAAGSMPHETEEAQEEVDPLQSYRREFYPGARSTTLRGPAIYSRR